MDLGAIDRERRELRTGVQAALSAKEQELLGQFERRLAEEPEQFRLAVSLHGATDALRAKIMPVNRRFPLWELTAALEHYQARQGRMLTFEYILIDGINDTPEQARALVQIAGRLRATVNLIPYNPVEGLPWRRLTPDRCREFRLWLDRANIQSTLRMEKGTDINAACGQLRLQTERQDLHQPPLDAK